MAVYNSILRARVPGNRRPVLYVEPVDRAVEPVVVTDRGKTGRYAGTRPMPMADPSLLQAVFRRYSSNSWNTSRHCVNELSTWDYWCDRSTEVSDRL